MAATEHNLYSSYREALLEHLFAGEIMRHIWLRGNVRIEVLKPQVDDAGYDLVLEANGIVRHAQLKTSHSGAATAGVTATLDLARKPSGCVVWIIFDPDDLRLMEFRFFGGSPGAVLPDIGLLKIAKHARGNAQSVKAERPNVRVIPKARFDRVQSVADLTLRLFGPPHGDVV